MAEKASKGVFSAVLIAAVITLIVTLVRLYGELHQWDPTYFSREPGGHGALVGISWLVPIFGFWFGRRLAQNGKRPASTGRALLFCVIGGALVYGVGMLAFKADLGLDHPTKGEVYFGSKPLGPFSKREMARYRRFSVGMIFQNFNLIPTMSAEENVSLALAFGGLRGQQRRERAEKLLGRVGLSDRTSHRPSELSGGEQQRVAIARALANSPKVLLADEPTGNLDSIRAHELLGLLRDMVNNDSLTILMVTHDQELANSFADRIVFMKDGRVV